MVKKLSASKTTVILWVSSTMATDFMPLLSYELCMSLSIEPEHATHVIPVILNSNSMKSASGYYAYSCFSRSCIATGYYDGSIGREL